MIITNQELPIDFIPYPQTGMPALSFHLITERDWHWMSVLPIINTAIRVDMVSSYFIGAEGTYQ